MKENFSDMSIVTENVCEFSDKYKKMKMIQEIIQENVHECTKICKICENFLLQMIPDIQ